MSGGWYPAGPAAGTSSRSRSAATAWSAWIEARGRNFSPQYRMIPLMIRNTPATMGLPKISRNGLSATTPTRPTGMVARMIIQASFWSRVRTWRCRIELKNPPMIRTQSRQK